MGTSNRDLEAYLSEGRLLCLRDDGTVHLPLLLRGQLIAPTDVDVAELQRALNDGSYAEVGDVQVVREEVLDAVTLRPSGRHVLFVMPRIVDPERLLIRDTAGLATDLYNLPFDEALDLIGRLRQAFSAGGSLLEHVGPLSHLTADAPRAFLDIALAHMEDAFDAEHLRAQVDCELAHGELRGSTLLDGWVELPKHATQGLSSAMSMAFHGQLVPPGRRWLRALPTRQLHITAGNSPMLPLVSCVRALALKSAAVVKIPSGALVAGSALAVAMHFAGPQHPLVRFSSIAYWRGGDERVENVLFGGGALDRIVVWGAPEAVQSVVARAGLTKTITFNPRYGVSLVSREAFRDDPQDAVRRAARDVMVWNQKACLASLVVYVEGSEDEARHFTSLLSEELGRWDRAFPNPLPREALGRLRRARRGALASGEWISNGDPTAPSSAAVYMPEPFDLFSHPMTRVAIVRSIARAEDVVARLSHSVSQVGVAGEATRLALRDAICGRGVSCVLPLGEADSLVRGAPHDSLRPFSELVSWVVS